MGLIVQKFGGSSIADVEKIKSAASKVIKSQSEGNQVIVIVSARGKTTDELIDIAFAINKTPDSRELDMLVSTGEQISISLMAMAIHAQGYSAISLTGGQVGIRTDSSHTKARIVNISTNKIDDELKNGNIVIVAGFQGIDNNQNITTLGRGGSDTTAVAIAAKMQANLCEIYTDVDGIYTADPRIVKNAKKLEKISYDEILELASLGAQVMQPRSIEFAKKYNVPIHVRSSQNNSNGTLICKEVPEMEDVVVSGATISKNDAKITIRKIPDKPGSAANIFHEISKKNINVDMIIQNTSEQGLADVTFTVPKTDLHEAMSTTESIVKTIKASDVISDSKIAKLSIVGIGMRNHTGIAERMFRALADEEINIQMISTSEIKVSCIIDENKAEDALNAIHKVFNLGK